MSRHYRPTDLPELRAELVQWSRTSSLADGYADMLIPGTTAGALFSSRPALRTADLFYVDPDMMALAIDAAATIPDFALAKSDLPSEIGFLYSPMPFWPYVSDEDTPPHGCAWAPGTGVQEVTGESRWGLAVAFVTDRDAMGSRQIRDSGELEMYRRTFPRLNVGASQMWEFGDPEMSSLDNPFLEQVKPLARIMKALWIIMQQSIAVETHVRPDRAAQKRMRRLDIEPTPVRVITLRRAKTDGGKGSGGREYHHRWIVRAHTRNQWYPREQVHLKIWIPPHIKGPEGAPLLGGEKVFHWKR